MSVLSSSLHIFFTFDIDWIGKETIKNDRKSVGQKCVSILPMNCNSTAIAQRQWHARKKNNYLANTAKKI